MGTRIVYSFFMALVNITRSLLFFICAFPFFQRAYKAAQPDFYRSQVCYLIDLDLSIQLAATFKDGPYLIGRNRVYTAPKRHQLHQLAVAPARRNLAARYSRE